VSLERQRFALDRLIVTHGLAPFGAAAVVGNGCGESGPSLDSTFDRGARANFGSGGFLEWRDSQGSPRKQRLAVYADERGPNLRSDLGVQVDYCVYELGAFFPALLAQLRAPGDRPIKNLCANFCWIYENPARATAGLDNRIAHAEAIYADWQERQVAPAPAPTPPHVEPAPAPFPPLVPPLPLPLPIPPPVGFPAPPASRQSAVLVRLLDIQSAYMAQITALQKEKAVIDIAINSLTGLSPPTPLGAQPKGDSMTMIPTPPAKAAISSSTIWGGLMSVLGGALPILSQIGVIAPPQWQPIISGALAAAGGLVAIYGRTRPNIAPVTGLVRPR
jgi:hypothetical protein